jgi:uncharacterized repeat protein (TIGR03803 family)
MEFRSIWSVAMLGKRLASVWAVTAFFALVISGHPVQAQTEYVLYNFGSQAGDGTGPFLGSLTFDKKGNLYGTTSSGGAFGYGTVFELTAASTEKTLHSFDPGAGDGANPYGGLTFGKKRILYGTTFGGGAYGGGTVFELTGKGIEKVRYSFGSQAGDASGPYAAPIFDKEGNLYGTTGYGGAYGYGTVFELTSAGTEKVLYSFGGQSDDGQTPYAGLIFDKKGNLYGTTVYGGAHGYGTIFELTAAGTEKVLYSFGGEPDGANPYAGLTFDKKGNLYGTTYYGGAFFNVGTAFELTVAGTEKVLYTFGSQRGDGASPTAGLIFDKAGNLYGATYDGAFGYGTVFELTTAGTENVLYSFGGQPDGFYPFAGLIFDKLGNLYGTTFQGGYHFNGTVFELFLGESRDRIGSDGAP